MLIKVLKIRYIENHVLEITFETGEKGLADFSRYAIRGGVFSRFADPDYFRQVSVDPEWGVLCWPGDVDIAPETVYEMVTGKSSDEDVERMAKRD